LQVKLCDPRSVLNNLPLYLFTEKQQTKLSHRGDNDLVYVEVIGIVVLGNGVFNDDDVVVQHWAVVFRRLVQVDRNTRVGVARLRLRCSKPTTEACTTTTFLSKSFSTLQETQLSQKGRAMLRVFKFFDK